jgi:hypothetical protein
MTSPLTSMPDDTLVYRLLAPDGRSCSLPIEPSHSMYATLEALHRDAVFAVYEAAELGSRCAGDMICEVVTAGTLKLIERQACYIEALVRVLAEIEPALPEGEVRARIAAEIERHGQVPAAGSAAPEAQS